MHRWFGQGYRRWLLLIALLLAAYLVARGKSPEDDLRADGTSLARVLELACSQPSNLDRLRQGLDPNFNLQAPPLGLVCSGREDCLGQLTTLPTAVQGVRVETRQAVVRVDSDKLGASLEGRLRLRWRSASGAEQALERPCHMVFVRRDQHWRLYSLQLVDEQDAPPEARP